MDKPFEMATLEQKRVSQIQGFVKIVPLKKSRSIWKTCLMIFCDFPKNGIFFTFLRRDFVKWWSGWSEVQKSVAGSNSELSLMSMTLIVPPQDAEARLKFTKKWIFRWNWVKSCKFYFLRGTISIFAISELHIALKCTLKLQRHVYISRNN